MASSDTKLLQESVPSAARATPPNETYRAKSIATRLTETEFAEIESAAAKLGRRWRSGSAMPHRVRTCGLREGTKGPGISVPKAAAKRRQIDGEYIMKWSRLRAVFPWRIALLMSMVPAIAFAMLCDGSGGHCNRSKDII